MESSIVIKVKYEDTLRRFKARIINEELDLNMDGLRKKIVSLFKLARDTQFHFTYEDEDNDVVELVDDEDLRDVARQALNPLRITASPNSSPHSTGSSTPRMPPPLQEKLHNFNSSVSEILRSLPELNEPLSKLSFDLTEIASTYGASNTAEITDTLSKVGLHYLSHISESRSTKESKKFVEVRECSDGLTKFVLTEVASGASCVKITSPKIKNLLRKSISTFINGVNPQAQLGLINASQPVHPIVPNAHVVIKDKQELKETGEVGGVKFFGAQPVANNGNRTTSVEGRRKKKSVSGLQSSSAPLASCTCLNECPFTGMPIINNSVTPHDSPSEMPERIYSCSYGIFHRAIRCDGCGVHPVTGPRFKSNVKEDYDLCSICFAKMGNDADFVRIERPVIHNRPSIFKNSSSIKSKGHGGDATPLELDSSVILDVNVILDSTIMSPLANFQRTWRMRNNGKTAWPQGTRLVWIGGVKMTANPSIELEISSAGVQVGHELDVSVDFVAPERNGRYISYLRMALPNGQKFGQRLWVLINVDDSLKKPMHAARPGFNLNLPPGSEDVTSPEVDAPIPETRVDQSLSETDMSNASIGTVDAPMPMMDQNLPELDMSNGNALVEAVDAPIPELTVDQSLPENVDAQTKEETVHNELREMGFNHASLNKEILKTNDFALEQTIVDICGDSGWDTILEELEEMGFNDEDIKKRLLRKNDGC